ncbi:MAG: SDR family oxidoreductase [Deltaproteobacteria bacterium]|nr:SDR family oxidoreductase [Deltaproteobacteria bacterium]
MTTSTNSASAKGIAVVIGANRGIGFELATQLQQQGYSVIGTCRSDAGDLEGTKLRVAKDVDMTKDGGLENLRSLLEDKSVALLIVNAGVLLADNLDTVDFADIRLQFEVNTLGPLRAVRDLKDKLTNGAKVGLMTSRMGSITDNTSGNMVGYRVSKTALNQVGMCLAHDLSPRDIAVTLLHPGFVKTKMTGGNGHVEANEAARGLLERMHELTLEKTGTFWHANGEALPW